MGKDTTCIDLSNDNYKILLYEDSIGCTSCQVNLSGWERIMKESDSIFVRKPEFVFIFQPKQLDERLLRTFLKENEFSHPVVIDRNSEIYKLNKFPSKPDFQCFLLDKENKTLLIGNPVNLSGIWQLIKKIITEKENV